MYGLLGAASTGGVTFLDILAYGKEINILLGGLFFLTCFLVFHIILSTRASRCIPADLRREILDELALGNYERARIRTANDDSLLSQVLKPGMVILSQPLERILKAIEGAGRRTIGVKRQEVSFLANIGVISPMFGLLGTVLGLMKAFNAMGTEIQEGSKAMLMTAHIGEAMGTTAAGLMVGIPAMIAYYLCSSRITRIGDDLEIASEEVGAALTELKRAE